MIVFPNCKINIGLRVLQKRDDGFHAIESVFYPVPFKDALEIIQTPQLSTPDINNYGLTVAGDPQDNLCIRAWHLLKAVFPALPAVQVHLIKNIPMGAGLGGGSSDGAFMLQLLNEKFQLGLSPKQLMEYALQLGSDCPFFILNKPAFAAGRGEQLEPIMLNLSSFQLVLVNPGIHVSTGWAFSQLTPGPPLANRLLLQSAVQRPVADWPGVLVNDFEKPVFDKYPAIAGIKDKLYQKGASYASMSGSGSTVFGLFSKNINFTGGLPAHYTVIGL